MNKKSDQPEEPIAQEAYDTLAEAYAALVDTKPHSEHLIISEEKRQVPIDRLFLRPSEHNRHKEVSRC